MSSNKKEPNWNVTNAKQTNIHTDIRNSEREGKVAIYHETTTLWQFAKKKSEKNK